MYNQLGFSAVKVDSSGEPVSRQNKEYQRIKLLSQLLHSNLDRYVQYVLNSSFLDSKSIKMIFSGDPGLWGGPSIHVGGKRSLWDIVNTRPQQQVIF